MSRRWTVAGAVALVATLAVALPAPIARAVTAGAVDAQATLTPRILAPGDTASFSIVVRGGVLSRVGFRPTFQLDDFEVVGGPSRSESLSYVNGAASRSLSLTWYLRATREGTASVQAIAIELDGDRIDLPAVTARVSRDAPPQQPDANGRRGPPGFGGRLRDPLEEIFDRYWPSPEEEQPQVELRAEVTPRRLYAGQQALYTLWLYTRNPIQGITPEELPDFRGFWVEEIARAEDQGSEPVELAGERYWRTPLMQRALYPLRPGSYEISPAAVELVATVGAASPFRRAMPRIERISRASNPLTISVTPLPPPPAELAGRFHGLVGDLSLAAQLAPAEVRVGEAATLELRLAGRGNVQALASPSPPLPDGVQALPPEEHADLRLRGAKPEAMRIEGVRTWSYPLVAERPGTWRLPPIEMAYFDPQAAEYRLATTRPLVLRARPGAVAAVAGGRPALHPIHNAAVPRRQTALGRWRRQAESALPWLFAAPWAMVVVAVLVVARGRRHAVARPAGAPGVLADPTPRAAFREARRRFGAHLAAAGRAERPRQAAQQVEDAWRDLLGSLAAVDASTPAARWPERLREAGASAAAVHSLDEVVADLHYLRYAPQLSAVGALRGELVERSLRLARRLGTE